MPVPVVVRTGAHRLGNHIRTDGLIEDAGKPTIGPHAKLPRKAASVDSTVIWRGIRRPPEPGGDREVRGGNGNRGSRDPVSTRSEKRRVREQGRSRRAPA